MRVIEVDIVNVSADDRLIEVSQGPEEKVFGVTPASKSSWLTEVPLNCVSQWGCLIAFKVDRRN